MASTRAHVGSMLTEEIQRYHRAMELNTHLATKCLRKLTENCLVEAGKTLTEHLTESENILRKCNLNKYQKDLVTSHNPDINCMDITLLYVLLTDTGLTVHKANVKPLKGIKDNRNTLSHLPDSKLPSDTIFNTTNQFILSIAKTIDNDFYNEMVARANDIHSLQLIKPVCTLDRFEMGESVYALQLLETTKNPTGEADTELLIRLNMSRFARQITRSTCPAKLMQHLKETDPTLAAKLKPNPECYTDESQMSDYIMKIAMEPKIELLKFCKCLRQVSPLIADLVESTNTDGQSTLECLTKDELSNIREVLRDVFEKNADESISSEKVHIIVEKKLQVPVQFDSVNRCLLDTFPDVKFSERDFSFRGLRIKQQKTPDEAETPHKELASTNLHEQTVDEFAKHVAEILREYKIVDTPFETGIIDHSLSPLIFIELTEPQMEHIFLPYLKKIDHNILGMGIKIALTKIQNNIRECLRKRGIKPSDKTQDLREFNTTVDSLRYKAGLVRIQRGNLLVAAHEFVSDFHESACETVSPNNFIAKRVVRFAAACMNERKNGTIHFGIEPNDNTSGYIIGIPEENASISKLEYDIFDAFRCSFGVETSNAIRCVNPVQCVPVEGGNVVIEVDVVPFSMYLTKPLLTVRYPPKGSQSHKYFGLDRDGVFDIPRHEAVKKNVKNLYKSLLENRKLLEYEIRHKTKPDMKYHQAKLAKLLTRGNDYVTNHLTPVIISGPISHSAKENQIRADLCCERAFSSASFVFDFDSSSDLRESMEKENSTFLLQIADDHIKSFELEKDWRKEPPVWLYCNGYDDNKLPPMSHADWMKERKHVAFKSIEMLRNDIQKGRGIVIFLIFGVPKPRLNQLLELARQTMLHVFEDECLVISDEEKCVSYLKNEVRQAHGKDVVERLFFTDLPWNEVSHVMNCVFQYKADVICRLPTSKGYFEEMTLKEKQTLNLTDLCIISGEECTREEVMMDDTEMTNNKKMSQESFYRGCEVTWWNFYYNHVGKRDLFDTYKKEMEHKLHDESDQEFVKEQVIQHQPGTGGSTVGRHLMWEFSQFNGHPESSYRCCIVKSITENTDKQIEILRSFKDSNSEKPLIIMIDNKDEDVDELVGRLNSNASKYGRHGYVYCLVLHVQRVDIWQNNHANNILQHKLSRTETCWFEDKYKEMQKETVNVDTLIAFNIMRTSFNEEYVKNTTSRVMAGVTAAEIDVLKCLALIRSFENRKLVPEEVFDDTMEVYTPKRIHSFRLFNHCRQLVKDNIHPSTTWNVRMTEAMSLLVIKAKQEDIAKCGLSIVSQLLAKAILEYLKREKNITLEAIVKYVLTKVETKKNETNQAASYFEKLVSSLFKTRHLIEGDKRKYFPELVDRLIEELKVKEEEKVAMDKVSEIIRRCFAITQDPMVGQQLARFFIHTKQFNDAESAIRQSLQLSKNVFLYHTYGYIYKSKMWHQLKNRPETECGIPDEDAVKIVDIAFKCIAILTQGQGIPVEKYEQFAVCHELAVTVVLYLLRACEKFSAIKNTQSFREFLNDLTSNEQCSSFQKLLKSCPDMEGLRVGRPTQTQMESSLRLLEDLKYNPPKITTLGLPFKQKVSMLRKIFSQFYGNLNGCSYNHGFSFNNLLDATMSCPKELKEQHGISKQNLEGKRCPKITDLLVYIGVYTLALDTCTIRDDAEFKRLLSYSARLRIFHADQQIGEKRAYLESYLYYALLHWPLKRRLMIENLAGPEDYCKNMADWKDSFIKNKSLNVGKEKVVFVLTEGSPGNDFALFDAIERYCQNEEQDVFSYARLLRLDGDVDNTGFSIKTKIKYPKHGEHELKVDSQFRVYELCHRHVTFVLGFTWKRPVALDVREKPRQAVEDPKLYPCSRKTISKETNKTVRKTKTVKSNTMDKATEGTAVNVDGMCTSDKEVRETPAKPLKPKKVKKRVIQPKAQRKKKTTTTVDHGEAVTNTVNQNDKEPKPSTSDIGCSSIMNDPDMVEAIEVSDNTACSPNGLDSEEQVNADIDDVDRESSDDTTESLSDDEGAYSRIDSPLSEGPMSSDITGMLVDTDAETSDKSDTESLGVSETDTDRTDKTSSQWNAQVDRLEHDDGGIMTVDSVRAQKSNVVGTDILYSRASKGSNSGDVQDSIETKVCDAVGMTSMTINKMMQAGDACSDQHVDVDRQTFACKGTELQGTVSDTAIDTCVESSDIVQAQSCGNETAELPTTCIAKTTDKGRSRKKKQKYKKHKNKSRYAGKSKADDHGSGDV